MIIWSGKPVYFFNSYWVTFHWLQQLNGICRLRYRQRFEVLKLFRLSGFYSWNVMISSNTITFRKLLLNHTDFFRVHIKQDWHFLRIFTRKWRFFQSSHIPVLLPNSVYSSYKPILTVIIKLYILLRAHIYQCCYFLSY